MARLVIGVAALALVLGALPACDSDEGGDPDRCASATYEGSINAQGKRHGERCTTNEECMYGLCYMNSSVTGGQFGICTKDCGCGDETTECSFDDPEDGSFTYLCYRPPIHGDSDIDTLGAYCVPQCKGVGDADSVTNWCAAHDTAYDTCETPFGVYPVCTTGDI